MFIDYDTADKVFSILCEDCGHVWKFTKEDCECETDYAWYFFCPKCGKYITEVSKLAIPC